MFRLRERTIIKTAAFIILLSPICSSLYSKTFRDVSCLKERFVLSNEVDLNRKEFKEAVKYIKAGDTKGADSVIVDALLRSAKKSRLKPWGYATNAVSVANDIMKNQYKFWVYDKISIPLDRLWKKSKNMKVRTWAFFLFSFDFLNYLNEAYRQTKDVRYLDRAMEIIEEFNRNCTNPKDLPSSLSWYDHPVANRVSYLIDYWNLLRESDEVSHSFAYELIELIWRHAKFLKAENNYNDKTNHGIFASYALMRIAIAFPQFREAPAWKKLAIRRMEQQIRDNFTPSGIHREYSTYYQFLVAEVLREFREDCRHNNIKLSLYFNKTLNRVIKVLPCFMYPDGSIALFGDSDDRPNDETVKAIYKRSPSLRFIGSGGMSGKMPRVSDMGFSDAKFFIMRSGWGKHRKLEDESCLIANYTDRANAHEHQDFMSLELYARGKKWVTDLGRWTYELDDQRRKYIVSAQAHNVIVPYYYASEREKAKVISSKRSKRMQSTRISSASKKPLKVSSVFIHQLKSLQLKDEESVAKIIDSIGKVKSRKDKIEAYRILLQRNPRWYKDRIIMSLATIYSESEDSIYDAMKLLDEIVSKGPDNPYYQVAIELKSTLAEEMRKKGLNLQKKTLGKVDEQIKIQSIKKSREADQGALKSARAYSVGENDFNKKLHDILDVARSDKRKSKVKSSSTSRSYKHLIEIKPNMNDRPHVFGWKKELKYDYLEGEISFEKTFLHKRAILFIKPYYFLILDRVKTTCNGITKQLFHFPPYVIKVRKCDNQFELTAEDSSRCLIYYIQHPVDMVSNVVKGRQGPLREWQGWYSGVFNNFVEAPVIENTVRNNSTYYIATLFVPIGKDRIESYRVDIEDDKGWDPSKNECLNMVITEPYHMTTIHYRPSSHFLGSSKLGPFDPVIEVKRRKR